MRAIKKLKHQIFLSTVQGKASANENDDSIFFECANYFKALLRQYFLQVNQAWSPPLIAVTWRAEQKQFQHFLFMFYMPDL